MINPAAQQGQLGDQNRQSTNPLYSFGQSVVYNCRSTLISFNELKPARVAVLVNLL